MLRTSQRAAGESERVFRIGTRSPGALRAAEDWARRGCRVQRGGVPVRCGRLDRDGGRCGASVLVGPWIASMIIIIIIWGIGGRHVGPDLVALAEQLTARGGRCCASV